MRWVALVPLLGLLLVAQAAHGRNEETTHLLQYLDKQCGDDHLVQIAPPPHPAQYPLYPCHQIKENVESVRSVMQDSRLYGCQTLFYKNMYDCHFASRPGLVPMAPSRSNRPIYALYQDSDRLCRRIQDLTRFDTGRENRRSRFLGLVYRVDCSVRYRPLKPTEPV